MSLTAPGLIKSTQMLLIAEHFMSIQSRSPRKKEDIIEEEEEEEKTNKQTMRQRQHFVEAMAIEESCFEFVSSSFSLSVLNLPFSSTLRHLVWAAIFSVFWRRFSDDVARLGRTQIWFDSLDWFLLISQNWHARLIRFDSILFAILCAI